MSRAGARDATRWRERGAAGWASARPARRLRVAGAGGVLVSYRGAAAEEVEVAAFVGLEDVVEEEAAVAAGEVGGGRGPGGAGRASSSSLTCSVRVRFGTFSS